MNIGTCIFDLEGIIIDTSKYQYMAWQKLANELGLDMGDDANKRFKGLTNIHIIDLLLELNDVKMGDAEKLAMANKKNLLYQSYLQKISPDEILPGIYEFFIEIKTNHIKLALGSANRMARMILQRLDMINLFNSIVDGNNISKAKPDTEIFQKILTDLAIRSIDCLVFESNESGIEAAHKLNMTCIGVGNKEILKSSDHVISGFDAIEWTDITKMINH